MNIKRLFLHCLVCMAFFNSQGIAASQLETLEVSYTAEGQQHTVQGKRQTGNTFVFNESGKPTVKIATLDWPPYIGENICQQGWVQQLTIAMLASKGYRIESSFFPWARAVERVESGTFDILYPEYYIEDTAPSDIYKTKKRLDLLSLSKKIPGGPIAFMQNIENKVDFNGDLQSLKGEKIGAVRGYQNTPEFDTLMDKNFFSMNLVTADLANALMLVHRRVKLIIGDPAVLNYSILTGVPDKNQATKYMSSIETVKPLLQYNHLYYAVSKKSSLHAQLMDDMNGAIDAFEQSKEMFKLIESVNKQCGFVMDTLTPYKESM